MKEGGAEMLTEERFAEILRMLGEEKSVTVQELTEIYLDFGEQPAEYAR